MTNELAVRLRLAMSATLLTLWAFSWIFEWPLLGKYHILFLAALALQWPDYQFRRYSKTFTVVSSIILLFAVGSIAFVGYALGDSELTAVLHSPYFVLPAWALGFLSIVLNAVPDSAPPGNQRPTAAGSLRYPDGVIVGDFTMSELIPLGVFTGGMLALCAWE